MIRRIINDLTPPLLKRVARKLRRPSYAPGWITMRGRLEGIELYLDPGTSLAMNLSAGHDTFFYDIIARMRETKKNLVIYDIGAYMGYHTLGFAKYSGTGGKVYAFEPHPLNLERLRGNIERNSEIAGKIKLFETAVSDFEGTAAFRMFKNIEEGVSSASCIIKDENSHNKENVLYKETGVKTINIDTLISRDEIDPPDLIKLDIEGAEHKALKGAEETIRKYLPVLLIEIHTISNMYLVYSFLTSMGYKVSLISEEPDGRCFLHCYTL